MMGFFDNNDDTEKNKFERVSENGLGSVSVLDVREFLSQMRAVVKKFGLSELDDTTTKKNISGYAETAKKLTGELEEKGFNTSMPEEFKIWQSEVNELYQMAGEKPPYNLTEEKEEMCIEREQDRPASPSDN